MHRERHLIRRQTTPAVFQNIFYLNSSSIAGDHKQGRHLAQMLMRDADYRAIDHILENIDDLLDLSRRDVLAAADNEFLQPARDCQKAVNVAARQIAWPAPLGRSAG